MRIGVVGEGVRRCQVGVCERDSSSLGGASFVFLSLVRPPPPVEPLSSSRSLLELRCRRDLHTHTHNFAAIALEPSHK